MDFFDPDALAQQVDRLLQDEEKRRQLGLQAHQRIIDGGYDLQTCLRQQLELVNQLMYG